MRCLPLVICLLFSLVASGQNAIIRGSKEIILAPYNESAINAHVNIQFKDSTKYKDLAFWQNRGNGFGRWSYVIDSSFQRNDSLFLRRGSMTYGYPLGAGSSTFDTTTIYQELAARITFPDLMSSLAPYLLAADTASLNTRILNRLRISDTAAMLTNYQRKPWSAVLTDGPTITWNFAVTQSPEVTVAGNRTLSITNLPTTPYAVSYGCITIIMDATGGRDVYPPANSRGVNGMGLASGNPFPLDKTGGAKNKACFEWKQSENIIYWTIGRGAN